MNIVEFGDGYMIYNDEWEFVDCVSKLTNQGLK